MALTSTREFRWDDPFAPTLTGEVGSWYNIVKQCLGGGGYGTRQGLGWTLVFDDPVRFTCVLRNSMAHGGTGCYLRVQDDGSSEGGARVARMDLYESMTDIDTGHDTAGGGWLWKARLEDNAPSRWYLCGDGRTVYGSFYVDDGVVNNTSRLRFAFGFGDMIRTLPVSGSVPFIAMMGTENPGTSAGTTIISEILTNSTTSRDYSFNHNVSNIRLLMLGVNAGTNVGLGSQISSPENDILVNTGYVIHDGGNSSTRHLSGYLRGVYVPLINMSTFGDPMEPGEVVTSPMTPDGMSLAAIQGAFAAGTAQYTSIFVDRFNSWDS